jgi:predicted deacetylase
MTVRRGTLAVALHDIEPATFERCALIRDWLHYHGVDRVTLLVVPAADLHPFFQRRPDLAAWLLDCRDRGDTVAQHGFQRERARRPEFSGLCAEDTRASLEAGRKLLALAGVAPRGFVAPGYAYTPVLRRELAAGYDWWATMLRLVSRERDTLAPALSLRRSPLGVRARSFAARRVLRLDLHPVDFDRPRRVLALEAVLRGASGRRAVTYDELAPAPFASAGAGVATSA